jgi:membrane-bound lytic murein transglycosylase B
MLINAPFCRSLALLLALSAPLSAQETPPPATTTPVPAPDATPPGFEAFLQLLAARARADGVSEPTIQAMTTGLTYNPRVIEHDRNQPGTNPNVPPPPFAPYRISHVDAARIARGRAVARSLGELGTRTQARYGVPLSVILAIWGAETDYGGGKGDFDLARSLATLAFEGRRRDLFAGEFVALLKMVDRGVPREKLVGSWAGAFGNPQFLPSVYLRVARDGDGDGLADIWSSRADTLASIATYFRDAGWKPGLPWGIAASVPAGLDRAAIAPRLASPSCPRVHNRHSQWKTVAEWRDLGVIAQGALPDDTLTSLFEPDGIGKPAFLLTGNYRVILDYNCSNYYALSVGLLADEIAR